MDFKFITPGEMAEGQYVTVLGFRPQKKEVLLPTGDFRQIVEEDKNPWIKGLPFRILKVNLPLVMLHNCCNAPNIPPVVFHDTRLIEHLEIDEHYAATYAAVMFPQKLQVKVIPAGPSTEPENEGDEDGQQVFNFGPDDEPPAADGKKGGEDGPPPLVPA